jgi:hypothetical protein
MQRVLLLALIPALSFVPANAAPVTDASPLLEKAKYLQADLIDKHLGDGIYVSITNVPPPGIKLPHTVDQPGNVIHSGVWTGRYLAGVAYQYAVTKDPWARRHAQTLLDGLHRLQAVTGKPGLLARGFVRGHGPVEDWERGGRDSKEWHQGQGEYADYRWYGDVSVDNFNAVLHGYSVYYDLAADAAQKKQIAADVDRMMTHVVENRCRIIDVDGEVTLYGHIGIDPDPARDEYYQRVYASRLDRYGVKEVGRLPLRSQLMLLPDLLIAHRITGKQSYLDLYRRVVERFRDNPDPTRNKAPYSQERLARLDHSPEGQAYEALYTLVLHEKDPALNELYKQWVRDLWEANYTESNAVFAFMTVALVKDAAHASEGLRDSLESLREYPLDRVMRPVMNSLRSDIERNPHNARLAAKPVPMQQRPLDNEYAWKGNPYQLDAWLKPQVIAFESACDDPEVAWYVDGAGRLFHSVNGWKTWRNVTPGLAGTKVTSIRASNSRTFVLHAQTKDTVYETLDGGLSWRAPEGNPPTFEQPAFSEGKLVRADEMPAMKGWRIPRATYVYRTSRGLLAGGPGGAYLSRDGVEWREQSLWREQETGAADFLHAYWMGRHFGFVK